MSAKLSGEPAALHRLMAALPDWDRSFLLIVVLVSGTVTLPQVVGFGETSGLGVWTTVIAAGVWGLWLVRPYYPRELAGVLMPLTVFSLYAAMSLSWGGFSVKALQNLSVSVGFIGFVLLAARECESQPAFAFKLHRALDAASIIAGLGYTVTVLLFGQGGEATVGGRMAFAARPFALFASVAVARQVARWQAGEPAGFWVAGWLVALVFLSQSRLGMVACIALFPLAMCCRGDGKSIGRALAMTALAAAVLGGSIFFSQAMYDRFFAYDAQINVGGVAINASGRTKMWQTLLDDLHGPSVFFGKGAGAAGRLIDVYFPGLGHPHNDFLRFLYDFGVFGLAWWAFFLLCAIAGLIGRVRRCVVRDPYTRQPTGAVYPDMPLHLTPLLALAAIIASMFTDNSVSYVFVMAPLGMLVGCSLSRLRHSQSGAAGRAAPKGLYLPNWDADAAPRGGAAAPEIEIPERVEGRGGEVAEYEREVRAGV